MSSVLERVLADVDRLDPQDRLKVIAHVIDGLQNRSSSSPPHKLSRKDLFGCLRGQITMAEDFNAPLSDFAEYM
jgi:Protein of unknown function (DUF2281)